MKKAIFAALALALTFGAFQYSWAAGRTSVNLASTANLINNVTKPDPESVPIGTVIAWPYAALPSDGNWAECNGATVNGIKTPDYRGFFLRGYGGNSAALGVQQSDMVGTHSHYITIPDGDGWGSGLPATDQTDHLDIYQRPYHTQPGNGMGHETRPVNKAVKYIIKVR